MAKLHLPGDWSSPLVFGLAGLSTTLIGLYSSGEHTNPERTELGLVLLAIALFLSIGAFRGREIEDTSVYYYWKSLETSFGAVIFSALLVFCASGFLIQTPFNPWMFFISLGFLTFAYYFSLHARITVLNKNKTFLSMIGKPWSFTRKYKAKDFKELRVSSDFSYAGQLGMIQHWQRHFFIVATNGKNRVLLLRANTQEEAKKNLQELSELTGLPICKEELKQKPLAPGLKMERMERAQQTSGFPYPVGNFSILQKEYPSAQLLKKVPDGFPKHRRKKTAFDSAHFLKLLKTAGIPYYCHGTLAHEGVEVWYFKNPLVVPLKELSSFQKFWEAGQQNPKAYVLFKTVDLDWKEFVWMPAQKYPPLESDDDTKWWWGRQGKEV